MLYNLLQLLKYQVRMKEYDSLDSSTLYFSCSNCKRVKNLLICLSTENIDSLAGKGLKQVLLIKISDYSCFSCKQTIIVFLRYHAAPCLWVVNSTWKVRCVANENTSVESFIRPWMCTQNKKVKSQANNYNDCPWEHIVSKIPQTY